RGQVNADFATYRIDPTVSPNRTPAAACVLAAADGEECSGCGAVSVQPDRRRRAAAIARSQIAIFERSAKSGFWLSHGSCASRKIGDMPATTPPAKHGQVWLALRRKAQRLFAAGDRQSSIARKLGVSRQCVHNWYRHWRGVAAG